MLESLRNGAVGFIDVRPLESIWIADAHRDDGKRFIVHADEKLTAFFGIWKRPFAPAANWFDKRQRFFADRRH